MKFCAVIFDMDGLMLDTERVYRDVFNRAAADCRIEFPRWLHEKLLGRNTADCKVMVREHCADDALFERYMERMKHHFDLCFAAPPPIKQGLSELLEFIESRGVPKIVATSTPRTSALARLAQVGLLERFVTVTCGDEVAHGKPAPDLFLKAARSINMSPEKCVVLEDSEAGVTGAHAAGMTVCMVPDLKQPVDDVRAKAQGVYRSLVEVRTYLSDLI